MTTTRPTISTEAWNNMTAYEQEFLLNWEGYKTMTATRPETISKEWWDDMTPTQQEIIAEHERMHEVFRNYVAQDLYTYDKAQDRPIKVRPFPQSVKEQDQ